MHRMKHFVRLPIKHVLPTVQHTHLKHHIEDNHDGHKEEVGDKVPESGGEPVYNTTHPANQLQMERLPRSLLDEEQHETGRNEPHVEYGS